MNSPNAWRMGFISLLVLVAVEVAALPAHSPRPGGVAVIEVGPASNGVVPRVRFGETRALLTAEGGRWFAVVGIPLEQPVGEAAVTISIPGEPDYREAFEVVAHNYREQRLTVENRSYVNPDPAQLERIASERQIIDAALSNWRDQPLTDIAFVAPVEGPRSSSFGLRRFFNEQPRAPHKGMDIAADTG
ncbi:MAG TPA: M23 family peptidase, partial [Woeseiaceae bacterium]